MIESCRYAMASDGAYRRGPCMAFVSVIVDDKPILMEVDDRVAPPPVLVGQGGFEDLEGAVQRVASLGEFVQDACVQVYRALTKAAEAVRPDEVEVTFGVTVGGEAGIPFMAKGKAEASLEITLKWFLGDEANDGSTEADTEPHV
jgi:hypothetical protein